MNPASHILIVEDSDTQALKLQYLLEEEGWTVKRSATAEQALEELIKYLPDLIIADYHLPGIRGDEFCRRVRMNVRTRGIPILMLTVEGAPGKELAGLESGADSFVSKSVSSEVLLLRVRTLMRTSISTKPQPDSRDTSFRRARLMAVDDSPTYLGYLAELLQGQGYEVTQATDGSEALQHLEHERFDCVMVDLVMPKVTGIEVCRRISEINREDLENQPTAVIMLTSSETQEDMTRSLEAGADDFVGKSSDLTVLIARIRALLRRKFFQEENRRILEDLRNKELEALRKQAEREAELHNALKQAYDDLRQTQDAVMQQERLRALGQMASGIAHDINNAISPVVLYTDVLMEREPNLSPRTRQYLELTQRALQDVAHTVGRMREFCRPRPPELLLNPVDLNTMIGHAVDLTRARWSDMPQQLGTVIDVRLELAEHLPSIAGVESEIREALTNLIFNAVDAMPQGGTLTLRTKVRDSNSVVMEVADTGAGMDEETRRRCFEPFFTSKGERGTGLGLAMVYGIVRRHSASIEIDTAPGKGTTVRVGFPLAKSPTLEAEEAAPEKLSNLRILVVDDDPAIVRSLRDTLEGDGHQVVTAGGGQEAIDVFRSAWERGEVFDVVTTDLGMPYVDGRKVAAVVKMISPSTLVILLTGWGQKLMEEGDTPTGVDRILRKPPKLQEIRRALTERVTVTGDRK